MTVENLNIQLKIQREREVKKFIEYLIGVETLRILKENMYLRLSQLEIKR
jgi:hypothetical protein